MEQRINGHTRLYALIGSPVGHSGSPAMYNYSFAKLGLDCAYLAFDIPVEKTKDAIDAFRTLNVGGFNITMPDGDSEAGRPPFSRCGTGGRVQYRCGGRRRHDDRAYDGRCWFCAQFKGTRC